MSFVVAHGQMAAHELDERMNAFYDGRYDVLVSTTIVESGLDIPAANTLIVERADMFGLAQLYQIRGRVGRSKLRAYAFFMTEPRKKLTPQAEKRLRVLGRARFASGPASRWRARISTSAAPATCSARSSRGRCARSGSNSTRRCWRRRSPSCARARSRWPTTASGRRRSTSGVPVLIPEAYVADLDVRLGLYRRLSALERKVELEGFAAELIDRFGPLPAEVETLLLVVRIKALCKRAGIARLDGGPKGATVQFHNDKYANPAGLVQFLNDQKGLAQGQGQPDRGPPRLERATKARLAGAFAIARDLAALARPATTDEKRRP